jgi:glutathione S-transferase
MKHTIKYRDGKTVEVEASSFVEAVEKHKFNLDGANLTHANLTNANLTNANLTRANLIGAILTDAILDGANLDCANLIGAILTDANLTRADIRFASWPLWCGTRNVKVDWEQFKQLVGHVCWLNCEDERAKKIQEFLLPTAKKWKHWKEWEG